MTDFFCAIMPQAKCGAMGVCAIVCAISGEYLVGIFAAGFFCAIMPQGKCGVMEGCL